MMRGKDTVTVPEELAGRKLSPECIADIVYLYSYEDIIRTLTEHPNKQHIDFVLELQKYPYKKEVLDRIKEEEKLYKDNISKIHKTRRQK